MFFVFLLQLTPLLLRAQAPCNSSVFGANTCAEACVMCDVNMINGYTGSTAGYSIGSSDNSCMSIENDQWFAFVASSSTVAFNITSYGCFGSLNPYGYTGIQAQVYSNCYGAPVSPCVSPGYEGPTNVTASNLVIGQQYYLLIDGFAASWCDFDIEIAQGGGPVTVDDVTSIQGTLQVCSGAQVQYSVGPVSGAAEYVVDLPAMASIAGQTGQVTIDANSGVTNFTVTFADQVGPLCVSAQNLCASSAPFCIDVELKEIHPTILDTLEVCFGSCETFGVQIYCTSGLMSATYTTAQGCDSTVEQYLKVLDYKTHDLGDIYLCASECVQVGYYDFCNAGSYSTTVVTNSPPFCDSVITFNIIQDEVYFLSTTTASLCNDATGSACLIASNANLDPYSYQWDNTGLPDQSCAFGLFAGTYQVSVTDVNACTYVEEVIIEEENNVYVGRDTSIQVCSSDSAIDLFAMLGQDVDSGGLWTPQTYLANGWFDAQFDASQTYTYTIAQQGCQPQSAQIQVQVIQSAWAGNDVQLTTCETGNLIDLFAQLDQNTSSGGVWITSDSVLASAFFDPASDQPGEYTYVVASSNQMCKTDSSVVSLQVASVFDAGSDQQIDLCEDAAPFLLQDQLAANATLGGVFLEPTENQGYFNASVDLAGQYTYVVGGVGCPSDTAYLNFVVEPTVSAGVDLDLNFCEDTSFVDLMPFLQSADLSGYFVSNTPSIPLNESSFSNQQSGIYTLYYVVDALGSSCKADSAQIQISVKQGLFAGNDQQIELCETAGIVDMQNYLDLSADQGGVWSNQSGLFDASNNAQGHVSYVLNDTAGVCTSDTAYFDIHVHSQPQAGFNNTIVLCGTQNTLIDLTDSLVGSPSLSGYWMHENDTVDAQWTISSLNNGLYTYIVEAQAPCLSVHADLHVELMGQHSANFILPDVLCEYSEPIYLQAAPGGTWSGVGIVEALTGLFDPDLSGVGTHQVVYSMPGICPTQEIMTVQVAGLPQVTILASDTVACAPFEVDITASEPSYTYQWTTDQQNYSGVTIKHVYEQSGYYDVELIVEDSFCVDTLKQTKFIEVLEQPQADFDYYPSQITMYEPFADFFNESYSATDYQWFVNDVWQSNQVNSVLEFDSQATYLVCLRASNQGYCADTLCKEVEVLGVFNFYIPSAFTPDGDGLNEGYGPVFFGERPEKYEFVILDRWSNTVFSSNDPDQKWDGSYLGLQAKQDVYIWKMRYFDDLQKKYVHKTASVTLIR